MFNDTDMTRNVRKIIEGKAYNTGTSELIATTYGCHQDDYEEVSGRQYYDNGQSLYRTRKGNLFFKVYRDKLEACFGILDYIDIIRPISINEAREWLEKWGTDDELERCFVIPEAGDSETALSVRIPDNAAKAIRVLAKLRKISLNSLFNNLVNNEVKENLPAIKQYIEEEKLKLKVSENLQNK